jgi:hypothetical protein
MWLLLAPAAIIPVLFAQSESEKSKPAAKAAPKHFMVAPGQAKWTAPPEGTIRGTPSVDGGGTLRYALISGEPMKPGASFTIRLECSDGYKAAPHWHPTDENLVVLSGTFAVGTGDQFDPAGLQDMPTGGYTFMPRRMHHFGLCKGETDVLIYGTGPFQINFLGAPGAAKAPPAKKQGE